MLSRRQLFTGTAAVATVAPVAAKVAAPTAPKKFATPDKWYIAILDKKGIPLWREGLTFDRDPAAAVGLSKTFKTGL